jgi:beta-lactamase superfamily II metal-dependent hydrolase
MHYFSRPLFSYVVLIGLATALYAGWTPALNKNSQTKSEGKKDPQTAPAGNLEIYYVDVEGGAATLIVTPARESILVDAGWAGFGGRDAKRIQQAMTKAGITEINHLVITHYHADHNGGVPELTARVKINNFYDHGPRAELDDDPKFSERYEAYRQAANDKIITLKPGDQIKLKQVAGTPRLTLLCLASNKTTLKKMRKIAKVNPVCKGAEVKPEDKTDNARSIVLWLRYGSFDFINPGDVTWNVEGQLVCPYAPLGAIDLYQVSHHGLNASNNPVILRTLSPTVTIMNNGASKAGNPETIKALRSIPSIEAMYQVHLNMMTKPEDNADPDFIANLTDDPDEGNMLTVAVESAAGKFSVTNGRTGVTRSYRIK